MSLIRNVIAPVAVAASLVLAPLSASALSVKFFENNVELSETVAAGSLLLASEAVTGGEVAVSSGILNFPPVDQLLSTFVVSGAIQDVRIEVTHFFDNATPFDSVGLGSVANNFQFASQGTGQGTTSVTSKIFIGDEAYTQDIAVTSSSGILDVATQGLVIAGGSYWVTQILDLEFTETGGTATAEWINPAAVIPLPAGGLLLLTALGGLGLYRARKS